MWIIIMSYLGAKRLNTDLSICLFSMLNRYIAMLSLFYFFALYWTTFAVS
ncbi:hypothetical protein BN174_2100002 [Clostridioides difficile E15]|nr:hypothetical protein BN174_2100002 [Clostridioides difficile E15]